MNKLVLTRKRWFQLFDVQLLIALAVSVTRLFATKAAPAAVAQVVWEVVIIALTAYVQRPNKIVAVIDRWVCLLFASQILLALAALHHLSWRHRCLCNTDHCLFFRSSLGLPSQP